MFGTSLKEGSIKVGKELAHFPFGGNVHKKGFQKVGLCENSRWEGVSLRESGEVGVPWWFCDELLKGKGCVNKPRKLGGRITSGRLGEIFPKILRGSCCLERKAGY